MDHYHHHDEEPRVKCVEALEQELRALGRGGYGVVVAAVNRLDGRQYAVKKIPLDASSPAAHSRIMREVATLSRLQHPHVVRYFQCAPTPACLHLLEHMLPQ